MTSNIDASKPESGNALTANVRSNFAAAKSEIESLQANGIEALSTAEVDQLENIGTTTISSTQWSYVGVLDQSLAQADSVTFGGMTINGNIAVTGTVDGRDVATDGTKLDGIEAGADVTDTANVTAAGALMDSEVDADIKTLSLPANVTITAAGAALLDDADAAAQRTTLGLGTAAVEAVGTATGDVVRLEDVGGSPGLPAVDGSQLTGLGAPNFSANRGGVDQVGVAASTATKIQHDTEEFDSGGYYDPTTNHRFTPLVAGKYLVIASVNMQSLADGKRLLSEIFKNGALVKVCDVMPSASSNLTATCSAIIEMNGTTDFLEHYVLHTDSVARDVSGVTTATFFQAFRIGD